MNSQEHKLDRNSVDSNSENENAADSVKLVTLTKVNDEIHGNLILTALEANGVKATLTGVFSAGFRAEAPGYVSVVVKQRDFEKAKEILKELEEPIDWSKVDVGDPEGQ